MCFILIKWGELSFLNLILFIAMLIILICSLVFTFMLRCWRSSGSIKTTKRQTGIKIVTAAFALTIINLIICVIEEIVIISSFSKIMTCKDDTNEDFLMDFYRRRLNRGNEITELNELSECEEKRIAKDNEYYISYITLSYTELMLILSLCILSILKKRIIHKVDDNLPPVIAAMNPYGRQVIIVHPGEMGMGMQNYNDYNNNYNYNFNYNSQNMNFGKKKNNPNSNQYIQPQNVNVVSSKIKNQSNSSSKDKSYSSSRNFE